MTSIRLEKKQLEFDGRVWELRCNMAVLEALQSSVGGDFGAVMKLPVMQAPAEILAAMLNDYAEDMGWPERYTAKQIAKMVPFASMRELDVVGMLTRAIIPAGAKPAEAAPEDADPGN